MKEVQYEEIRFSDTQIMCAIKRVEAGLLVPNLFRELSISAATVYQWQSKFGGMDTSMMSNCLNDPVWGCLI